MISIIIPWANRKELELALPSIMESLNEVSADLTIVSLGGDKEDLDKQISKYKSNLKVVEISSTTQFNKAIALNVGAKYTTKPYLFFCDCDIILPPGIVKGLQDLLENNPYSFATIAKVKETEINSRSAKNLIALTYELKLKIKDGTEITLTDSEEDALEGTRSAPGLLMVRRSNFEKINGYNSQFDGWGWEDQDIICRLALYAKLKHLTFGLANHISHNDDVRMKIYTKKYNDRLHSRDIMFRKALNNYDNNNFMGTYLQDCKTVISNY